MHARELPKTLILLIALTTVAVVAVVAQPKPPSKTAEAALSRCWDFAVGEGKLLSASGAQVFVGSSGARVQSLSLDGKKLWATELGGEIASNMLVSDSGLFLVTSATTTDEVTSGGDTLRFLTKETGITGWAAKLPRADAYALGRGPDSVVVVTSKGVVESFDARTGGVKWRRELAEGFAGEPRFNQANAYAVSTSNQIFTVSLATGEVVSVKKLSFAPTVVGEIAGGIFTGDERGNLTSLGQGEKPEWNFKSGGRISAILETGDNLLAASNDNFVYFFTRRSGGIAWKKRMGDRVSQLAIIDGKFALLSGYEENGAHLIDLGSGKVAGQLVLREDEWPVARPIAADGTIILLTNNAVYGYRVGDCSEKQGRGPGK